PVFGSGEGSIHILDGTEIISPSRSGPPDTFVVVRDAVEILGGADVRIDGGYFRGGDANYFGPNNSVATVAAGEAFHLHQAVGVIYAGEFIGGEANSTSRLALARGGRGADIVESQLTLYGGTFVGGIGTYPGLPSQNPNVRQE